MTMFIAERWLQMQPRNCGKIGSSSYTTLSNQCEEALSRVSNTQTYFLSPLKEAFLMSLDAPRLVLALFLYLFSHRAMLIVMTQGTLIIPSGL
jgi:hypothetical protein